MKQLKKAAAVVLAGVMALTVLAGCGSSSSNSAEVELVNTMLRRDGSSTTVKESSSLTSQAEAYAAIKKQIVTIDADAADFDPENVDEDIIAKDEALDDQLYEMRDSLFNSHILLMRIGDWEYDDDDDVNDAQRAGTAAWYIGALENGYEDDDGNFHTYRYFANGERHDLGKVKVTGIGIAKVSGANDIIYKSECIDYCEHIDSYEGEDGMLHTENFDGWIVMISYE